MSDRLTPTDLVGDEIDLEELDLDKADDADPVELHRQLSEMDRVVGVDYRVENGFFAGVTVKLRHNQPDMLAEVMYDHDLEYHESWINTQESDGKDWDEWTHQVKFIPMGELVGLAMTARETQAAMPESVGSVFK